MSTIKPLDTNSDFPLVPVPENTFGESIVEVAGSGPGTGWFSDSKTIVTAAHVVGTDGLATAYWSGKALANAAVYFNSTNVPVPGSSQDIATLSVDDWNGKPLPIGVFSGPPAEVSIVGRLDGKLYRSIGRAYSPGGGLLLYNLSATGGMSGSPIFWKNKVVAIHLGSVNETALAKKPTWPGYINAGLMFTDEVINFLGGT